MTITPQSVLIKAMKTVCKVLPSCVLLGCCYLDYHSRGLVTLVRNMHFDAK